MNGSTVLEPDHDHDHDHENEHQDREHDAGGSGASPTGPETGIVVRRNAPLSAAVGGLASAVAIAYLARATGSGAWIDWVLCLVMSGLAAAHLLGLLDARSPLLVADDHGVRIREGRAWHGMTWDSLLSVEHLPRRGLLRDGRLDVVATGPDGAEQVLSVRLSMATTVVSAEPDLTAVLLDLTRGRTEVVELDPTLPLDEEIDAPDEVVDAEEPAAPMHEDAVPDLPQQDLDQPATRIPDPRPVIARGIGLVAGRLQRRRPAAAGATEVSEELSDDVAVPAASATPSPLRAPMVAVRTESVRGPIDAVAGATALDLGDGARVEGDLPEARELRRPGSVDLVEETVAWEHRVDAAPVVIDGFAIEAPVQPAADPVVGPVLAGARVRLGLSVDQLAERTRIRPHVIESIEVDDFAPCGGDFYARGHLRTLARVVGVDVAPLLASYDERYADAPIDPRRIFEAELATGASGSIRGTRGGPNWSVLVAAVMALVLAWSVARLVMDSPVDLNRDALVLNGSRGIDNGATRVGEPVAVLLTAAGGGTNVEVRDGSDEVVFSGDLAFGESKELKISPPVRVQTSDGSLEVAVAGAQPEAVGETGQPATGTFVAPAE
ncbi:helix-turn-helix domain-containing protein [Nocardioides sp. SYSU DS0663]|uniref:helix-turn-helix domain-containing protein n=1 Tax=Nocardioides sp. SYSU DS0663 TaxID=3416445 RepID=UPI003F4AFBC5